MRLRRKLQLSQRCLHPRRSNIGDFDCKGTVYLIKPCLSFYPRKTIIISRSLFYNKLFSILILIIWSSTAWADTCDIASFFSPFDDVEEVIHQELTKTKRTVHCSLFGISNPRLVQDLINLKQSGVEVIIAEDKRQAALKNDLHRQLQRKAIRVVIKKTNILEHNKFCVLDGESVVVGVRTGQGRPKSKITLS